MLCIRPRYGSRASGRGTGLVRQAAVRVSSVRPRYGSRASGRGTGLVRQAVRYGSRASARRCWPGCACDGCGRARAPAGNHIRVTSIYIRVFGPGHLSRVRVVAESRARVGRGRGEGDVRAGAPGGSAPPDLIRVRTCSGGAGGGPRKLLRGCRWDRRAILRPAGHVTGRVRLRGRLGPVTAAPAVSSDRGGRFRLSGGPIRMTGLESAAAVQHAVVAIHPPDALPQQADAKKRAFACCKS